MFLAPFFSLVLCLASLVLLVLISISMPLVKTFYFLHASQSGGVTFGEWGWCLDSGLRCSQKALGIDWSPQLVPWLTKALVLFPVAGGLTLLATFSLLPVLCTYRRDRFPTPLFGCLTFLAFVASAAALAFTLGLFITAKKRFQELGFEASYGPSIWMAVAATGSLAIVSLNSGCGCASGRGRFSRASPYLSYNV
ncbi:SUR7 family [Pyrrhoderma noxium]|uniref:SUR7 family n=1 Tax=Pyrrhoderma noxium TaxID=2282107 RepID=A0A286U9P0_9AGAM|nr:SUR7 family [Pyrrhoderma noxium]